MNLSAETISCGRSDTKNRSDNDTDRNILLMADYLLTGQYKDEFVVFELSVAHLEQIGIRLCHVNPQRRILYRRSFAEKHDERLQEV